MKLKKIHLTTAEAAEMLGLTVSTLNRARKSTDGLLQGIPAPQWEMIRIKSVKRVLYPLADLERWLQTHKKNRTASIQALNALSSVLLFTLPDGGPMGIEVKHRTYLRALSLKHSLNVIWHAERCKERVLLYARVPLPDGDAGYSHLTDDTPSALSQAAEEMVALLWRAMKSSPDQTLVLAQHSRELLEPLPSRAEHQPV